MSADRLLRQSSLENIIGSDSCRDEEMVNPVIVETSGDAEDLRHEIDEHVQREKNLSLPPSKKYHLFISYSAEDREDANKICEHMERRFQMKCMNFERNFVPGKSIDENISDEMQKSVKVLLILSPNYTQSHWCVTEAREACQLSFKDLCDVSVIPLFLRPLEKQLPPFLKSFVYIDAQKELDVPAKIYDAYLNPGNYLINVCLCNRDIVKTTLICRCGKGECCHTMYIFLTGEVIIKGFSHTYVYFLH